MPRIISSDSEDEGYPPAATSAADISEGDGYPIPSSSTVDISGSSGYPTPSTSGSKVGSSPLLSTSVVSLVDDDDDTSSYDVDEYAASATPAKTVHEPATVLYSERLRKQRTSREFTMPSGHEVRDQIPSTKTPGRSLRHLRRRTTVDKFSKETHYYNQERFSTSDVSSGDDDFIDDETTDDNSSSESDAEPTFHYRRIVTPTEASTSNEDLVSDDRINVSKTHAKVKDTTVIKDTDSEGGSDADVSESEFGSDESGSEEDVEPGTESSSDESSSGGSVSSRGSALSSVGSQSSVTVKPPAPVYQVCPNNSTFAFDSDTDPDFWRAVVASLEDNHELLTMEPAKTVFHPITDHRQPLVDSGPGSSLIGCQPNQSDPFISPIKRLNIGDSNPNTVFSSFGADNFPDPHAPFPSTSSVPDSGFATAFSWNADRFISPTKRQWFRNQVSRGSSPDDGYDVSDDEGDADSWNSPTKRFKNPVDDYGRGVSLADQSWSVQARDGGPMNDCSNATSGIFTATSPSSPGSEWNDPTDINVTPSSNRRATEVRAETMKHRRELQMKPLEELRRKREAAKRRQKPPDS